MAGYGWTAFSFLLIPALQISVSVAADASLSFTVRVGDDVSLPCESGKRYMHKCDSVTWLFSDSEDTIDLVKHGKMIQTVKSDRLRVTENCSLVIKKVTVEDVGLYTCRRFKLGQQEGEDPVVYLSVVTMTEHKENDEVTLICSVWTHERCRHKVKWLFANEHNKDLMTSQSDCSANVTLMTSPFLYTHKKSDSLKCEVTDGYTGEVQLFPFSPQTQASGEKKGWWWWYIIVLVATAALIITAAALVRRKRNKVNKTRMDDTIADAEGGISYASISFPTQTNSKAWVWGKGNAVIYSSVKAAASTDPNNIYAAIN